MKDKIIYTGTFILAFVIVTFLMIQLSSKYKNIFALDFTPVNTEALKAAYIEKNELDPKSMVKFKREILDTLKSLKEEKAYDAVNVQVRDTAMVDSLRILFAEIRKMKSDVKGTDYQKSQVNNNESAKDSLYRKWVKDSVKLYEAMDSKKAAKIIQGYSDNIARDIIFSMKKKKAAEIIAEFKPDIANRIISLQ